MGDTHNFNAMQVLCSGISVLYQSTDPDMDPEGCFHVAHSEPNKYFMYDEEFSQPLRIDKYILTNPHFDLAKWYQARRYPITPFNKNGVDLDLSLLEFWSTNNESSLKEFSDFQLDSNSPHGLQSVSKSDWDGSDTSSELNSRLIELLPSEVSMGLGKFSQTNTQTESDWNECTYSPMGDVLEETVVWILESSQLYPDVTGSWQLPQSWFEILQMEDDWYQVQDRLWQSSSYLFN